MSFPFLAGSGKSVLWYANLFYVFVLKTYDVGQFHDRRGDRDYAEIWARVTRHILL
jgi:hypothetical protein